MFERGSGVPVSGNLFRGFAVWVASSHLISWYMNDA